MEMRLSLDLDCKVCHRPIDRVPDPEVQRQIKADPLGALAFGVCPKCCTVHGEMTHEEIRRIVGWVRRRYSSRRPRPK